MDCPLKMADNTEAASKVPVEGLRQEIEIVTRPDGTRVKLVKTIRTTKRTVRVNKRVEERKVSGQSS